MASTTAAGRETPSPAPDAGANSHAGDTTQATEDGTALTFRGSELTAEETAAVVAVLSRLAQQEPETHGAGSTGPLDRSSQRMQRLAQNHHGQWGRPGADAWRAAAGGLR